ncbi:dirigent protein 23-like [Cornus florida]|uniref:dirigent protein 23-like n=1 Tax=Cornus florida TaxID=4283 RepID=UPI0028993580|nr:dirigent protein 23-like [Cornus florida]
MEKLPMTLLICSMFIVTPVVRSIAQWPEAVEEWFGKLSHAKEKVTKLHFYFHDLSNGKSPTAIQVAQANTSNTSPTLFGEVYMMDDLLTVGPEPSSKPVGRFEGLYGSASLSEFSLIMAVNFFFTDGDYNGSTLAVMGSNPLLHQYRELSIVGGSGIFRLARGVVTLNTYLYNRTKGNAIIEVNVVAIHY